MVNGHNYVLTKGQCHGVLGLCEDNAGYLETLQAIGSANNQGFDLDTWSECNYNNKIKFICGFLGQNRRFLKNDREMT